MRSLLPVRIARAIGTALALLGVAFVAHQLSRSVGHMAWPRPALWVAAAIAMMVASHGAADTLLALAWRELLGHLSVGVTRRWALAAFGVSQIARYIPGSVFHYVGRQAVGAAAGLPFLALMKSSVLEMASIVTAALLLAPAYLFNDSKLSRSDGGVALILAAAALPFLVARRVKLRRIATAVAIHFTYLTVAGIIFVGLLALASQRPLGGVVREGPGLVGAYALAWLAGLAAIGAPGGLGVREAALFGLLQRSFGHAELLWAIVLCRAANVAGDLAFYGWAAWARFAQPCLAVSPAGIAGEPPGASSP